MKISEKDVSRIWQAGEFRWLRDDAGRSIEVVYGGRPAARPGCDFQDAVLEINGVKCCGDVEIHVTSDLWKKHGHHRNPAYNNVILHVAMWETGGLPAVMHGGVEIPTVILNCAPVQPASRHMPYCPHVHGPGSGDGLMEILTVCGLQRLSVKSKEFAEIIFREPPGQALYLGICRSLGYARNKVPMARLAGLLPLSWWQSMEAESRERKLAMAMGTAGLLPSQNASLSSSREDGVAGVLEQEWQTCSHDSGTMQRSEWCFNYIRPANSPLRRVAAMCALMEKPGTGWLQFFQGLIEAADSRKAASLIEKSLLIKDKGYWSGHYDFCAKMNRPVAILGKGRVREIAINSILPFYLAYGRYRRDYAMVRKIVDIYTGYPVLPENEVTRFMMLQLRAEGQGKINGCRQQGLLHIFHTYCRTRECEKCPVSMRRKPGWG
jgi:hypothetical protein